MDMMQFTFGLIILACVGGLGFCIYVLSQKNNHG